jgi:hypothetical protein
LASRTRDDIAKKTGLPAVFGFVESSKQPKESP